MAQLEKEENEAANEEDKPKVTRPPTTPLLVVIFPF